MKDREIKVISEIRAYDSYFKVDKAMVSESQEGKETLIYPRFKLTRPDAVAVLILNVDSEKVILVKQFRYPVSHRELDGIIEIVAGKMDGDESPQETAIRETMEEIGYKITNESLSNCKSVYASPGYSTEKFHIFIATVNDSMKISEGGGLATEHESIDIIEMDVEEFMRKVGSGEIVDAKTIIAANMLIIDSLNKILEHGATISKK